MQLVHKRVLKGGGRLLFYYYFLVCVPFWSAFRGKFSDVLFVGVHRFLYDGLSYTSHLVLVGNLFNGGESILWTGDVVGWVFLFYEWGSDPV